MKNMLSKKSLFLFIIFLNSIIIGILIIIPLSNKILEYVKLYSQAFVEPFPEMMISSGKIEFLGPVPVKLTIDNSIQIICDPLPDEDYFATCPRNSVLISENFIWFKTNNGIKKYNLSEIKITDNPIKLSPSEVRSFLVKYAKLILQILSIVVFILIYFLQLLIVILGAGIGFMIDAFENGKFNFTQLINTASIFFTIFLVLNYVIFKLNWITIKFILINIVLFYLSIAGVVYYLSKSTHVSFKE